MKTFSVRLPDDLAKQLSDKAHGEYRSLSNMVLLAVQAYLEDGKKWTDRRSDVLLYEWENDRHAWIGGTHVSHKCTNRENQPVGLGLIAALVTATVNEMRVK